jgi:hemolysin activation/secretion protein
MKCASEKFLFLIALLGVEHALAQSTQPPVLAPNRIDQTITDFSKPVPTPSTTSPAVANSQIGFAKLAEVKVDSPLFSDAITDYWMPFLGKPVSADALNLFKDWFNRRVQDEGYFAYVTTTPTRVNGAEGSSLFIKVTQAVIGSVRINSLDSDKAALYAEEVARRFASEFRKGKVVDTRAMDAALTAIAFDLPLDLEINVKQQAGDSVEVEIAVRTAQAAVGKFLGGVVQLNNYGVVSYGRGQVLGVTRFAGFAPTAEFGLSFQVSEGTKYYKGQYETPLPNLKTRLNAWFSNLDATTGSGTSNVDFNTKEIGLGTSTLLSFDRYGTNKLGFDLVRRLGEKKISDISTAQPADSQLRVRFTQESSKGIFDSFKNDFVLTAGNTDLSRNGVDQAADSAALNTQGAYSKLEIAGGLKRLFGQEKENIAAMRWRAQFANKNLQSQNQFGLGGMDGVRAYNGAEGAGDSGATVSFDLGRNVLPTLYAGIFYDYGYSAANVNPLPSTAASSYKPKVQGGGLRLAGQFDKAFWNLGLAKSWGDLPDFTQTNISTRLGDWRLNFDATYPF